MGNVIILLEEKRKSLVRGSVHQVKAYSFFFVYSVSRANSLNSSSYYCCFPSNQTLSWASSCPNIWVDKNYTSWINESVYYYTWGSSHTNYRHGKSIYFLAKYGLDGLSIIKTCRVCSKYCIVSFLWTVTFWMTLPSLTDVSGNRTILKECTHNKYNEIQLTIDCQKCLGGSSLVV